MSKQKRLIDLWVGSNLKRKKCEPDLSQDCSVEVNEDSTSDVNCVVIAEDALDAVPELSSQQTCKTVSSDGSNQPKDFIFPKRDFPGCGK